MFCFRLRCEWMSLFHVHPLTQTHSYLNCLISVIGLLSAIEEVCSVAEMAGDRPVKCCVNTTQIDRCFDDVNSLLSVMSMVSNLDVYDRQAGQSKFMKCPPFNIVCMVYNETTSLLCVLLLE